MNYQPGVNCDSIEGALLIDQLFEERDRKKNKQTDLVENKKDDIYSFYVPSVGDILDATYLGVLGNDYVLNINFKDFLRVPTTGSEQVFFDLLEQGDKVKTLITNITDHPYQIVGSVAALKETIAREEISKIINNNESVEAYIKEMTPAGYLLDFEINGIDFIGFMPNTLAGINKINEPTSLVGQTMKVSIESYIPEKGTYILSRKKYLKTLIYKEIKQLKIGNVYTGTVTGSTEYGVFIEFNGCLTGMIHKANINPTYADRLKEIVPGTPIDFYVKEVLKDKIILTQILRETLWDTIEVDQKMEATVKDIKEFGVLVQLDEETRGLIHNNELKKHTWEPKIGAKVKVKVTDINRGDRKIYLTLN